MSVNVQGTVPKNVYAGSVSPTLTPPTPIFCFSPCCLKCVFVFQVLFEQFQNHGSWCAVVTLEDLLEGALEVLVEVGVDNRIEQRVGVT